MAKTIELVFNNSTGKTTKLTIESPKEPIDTAAVKSVMDLVVGANIFGGTNGSLVSAKGARLVENNVTEYELM